MSILAHVRHLSSRLRASRHKQLLEETAKVEKAFLSCARKLGIDPSSDLNAHSHYEILGIKYTNDQAAIKKAYHDMIKRYHPDISKDRLATHRTAQINQAYHVLKDKAAKAEYDTRFANGKGRISESSMNAMRSELIKNYNSARQKDFEEFNKRVTYPQSLDSLRAAVEQAADWAKRLRQASHLTFAELHSQNKKLRSLVAANRKMLKTELDVGSIMALENNFARLQGLLAASNDIEQCISIVVENTANELATEENNLADRLRRSVG